MSNIETAEIIQFADARTRVGKKPASKVPQLRKLPRNEDGITDTCINQRLRGDRRDVWREADAVMDYWQRIDENGQCGFPRSTSRHTGR
jgi:hypothetical protein